MTPVIFRSAALNRLCCRIFGHWPVKVSMFPVPCWRCGDKV